MIIYSKVYKNIYKLAIGAEIYASTMPGNILFT